MLDAMQVPPIEFVAVTCYYLVVAKPAGIPTVPLAGEPRRTTLLSLAASRYPEILQGAGKLAHEGLVLHRLDTATSGLVLIARSADSYGSLLQSQSSGQFVKRYVAAVSHVSPAAGFPPFTCDPDRDRRLVIRSGFRPYGEGRKSVRPVTGDSPARAAGKGTSRQYQTVAEEAFDRAGRALRICTISAGFRHQIRCHLAWSSFPIVGDALYGGEPDELLHLACTEIRFPDPITCEQVLVRWQAPFDWATATSEDAL